MGPEQPELSRTWWRRGRRLTWASATLVLAATVTTLSGCGAPASGAGHRTDAGATGGGVTTRTVPTLLGPLIPTATKGQRLPNGVVLAHVLSAHGSRQLGRIVSKGRTLYVTFVCLGADDFVVTKLFTFSGCDGTANTVKFDGEQGKQLPLSVQAAPAMQWRLLVMSGS